MPGIINRCDGCGLQFKTFDKKIADVYSNDYSDSFLNLPDYSGTTAVDLYNRVLEPAFARSKSNDSAPTLLDVGCGVGTMLETARWAGFVSSGVELCKPLAEISKRKGFEVFECDVADMGDGAKFDVITMMDIIEHLVDPVSVLSQLKSRLKTKGMMIVYTPNHDSMIVHIARAMYALGVPSPIENIFACSHTCFFVPDTLAYTVRKAGFRVLDMSFWSYDTSRPGQTVSAISKIGITIIEGLGRMLGRKGFRMVMYATPNSD